ncbi:MAG TPA: ribonuclease E inhibitor RraB [Cellvibrio sp.]
MEFPNDDDGGLLQMLHEHGIDLTAPMDLEFGVHCPDEATALQIEAVLQAAGYKAHALYDEGDLEEGEAMTAENEESWPFWAVVVFINMVPEYHEIQRIQAHLNELAGPLGGKSDGWGAVIE